MTRRKRVYLLETDNGFAIRIVDPDLSFMRKYKWSFIDNDLVVSRRLEKGEDDGFTEIVSSKKRRFKSKLQKAKRRTPISEKIRWNDSQNNNDR